MRLACCVPGCRRTLQSDGEFTEWICGRHWATTDKDIRKRFFLVRRRAKKLGWTPLRIDLDKSYWERLKKQAIERAMGI